MAERKRAYGYARVSTKRQANEGYSLDAQGRRIGEYCDTQNLNLKVTITDDGKTGMTLRRVGLQQVLQDAEAGELDVLVATSVDRIARNAYVFGQVVDTLERNGVRLVTLDDTFGGQPGLDSSRDRTTIELVAAFAAWQRERISTSTKDALTEHLQQGRFPNHPLLGFNRAPSGHLTPNVTELRVAQRINDLHLQGLSSTRIATQLNAEGVPSKRGGKWYAKTIQDQLNNQLKYHEFYDLYDLRADEP